jgi:hypothetical protein
LRALVSDEVIQFTKMIISGAWVCSERHRLMIGHQSDLGDPRAWWLGCPPTDYGWTDHMNSMQKYPLVFRHLTRFAEVFAKIPPLFIAIWKQEGVFLHGIHVILTLDRVSPSFSR